MTGVVVPPELARPLAKLAIIGAKMLSDRNGGLVLVPGMASLLAELASVAGDGASRTSRLCNLLLHWVDGSPRVTLPR